VNATLPFLLKHLDKAVPGMTNASPYGVTDSHMPRSQMAKPPPSNPPDPMAGIVDRLLAQLPGLQGAPEAVRPSTPRVVSQYSVSTPARAPVMTQGHVLGSWLRLLLALAFGMTMASWPYQRTCGFPLFGYLGAVVLVIWAGGWAATSAWRYRMALAHVLSLILILYGLMLGMAEILPRSGYTARQATWQCDESSSPQSWTAVSSFVSPYSSQASASLLHP
jgi:hypothetical protein